DSVPNLRSAIIDNLFLDGSRFPGLQADRIEARGGIFLRSSVAGGEISLSNGRLGGALECDGARVENVGHCAITADGLMTRSLLVRGAILRGGLDLTGARLGADFDATGATIERPESTAINADGLEAGGSIILRSTSIAGATKFVGARIGGDLDAT